MSAALAFPEDFPAAHPAGDAQRSLVGGDLNSSGQSTAETQGGSATALTSPDPAIPGAMPLNDSQGPVTSAPGQATLNAPPNAVAPARALRPVADQRPHDAQGVGVSGGDPTPPAPARVPPDTKKRAPVLADPCSQQGPAKPEPLTNEAALGLADSVLTLSADVLDDLERVRIANENRLRQLTRAESDSDGMERGFGLPVDHPDVARLAALVDGLAAAEHQAELNLNRLMRKHPLGPWVKQARGVGDKQAARLLAALGDPYWNTLHDRPRTVSELWAYAGYHVLPAGHGPTETHPPIAGGAQAGGNPDQQRTDAQVDGVGVAASRARGQKANWSATAKMRAYLVAVSIVKAGGPYREVYDQARTKYDGATHQVECKRCGPSGKPAQPGSAISAGHAHARALRAVSKEVLRDLWREAKRLHEET